MSTEKPPPAVAGTTATMIPWVERYRPKSLNDVSHQNEIVATLQNAVKTGNLPHLLLYGPPGSGKTSVALALCRQLWHPSQWRRRVLELNASDERGISVVRDKIKHFASLAVGNSTSNSGAGGGGSSSTKGGINTFFKAKDTGNSSAKGSSNNKGAGGGDAMDVDDDDNNEKENQKYPNPPFKIIILDEADTVTPDAQAALRRIIEAHSRITRFILICNYVTRIIEPLASRCAKFRFQPLPPASMKERLMHIADSEGCSQSEKDLVDDILQHAGGDMRRAVTTLQSVHALAAGGDDSIVLDKDAIAEIAGLPPTTVVDDLWNAMSAQAQSFSTMQTAVDEVCANGFSAQLLLSAILPKLLNDETLHERSKAQLAIRMAEAEKNMIEGADEYLQLMTVCSLALTCFQDSRNGLYD